MPGSSWRRWQSWRRRNDEPRASGWTSRPDPLREANPPSRGSAHVLVGATSATDLHLDLPGVADTTNRRSAMPSRGAVRPWRTGSPKTLDGGLWAASALTLSLALLRSSPSMDPGSRKRRAQPPLTRGSCRVRAKASRACCDTTKASWPPIRPCDGVDSLRGSHPSTLQTACENEMARSALLPPAPQGRAVHRGGDRCVRALCASAVHTRTGCLAKT